jgi:hypothetical protein
LRKKEKMRTLAYAATFCADDAGAEGVLAPVGVTICNTIKWKLRPVVLQELVACLGALPADQACSAGHAAAAAACRDKIFNRTGCPVAPLVGADGGAIDCAAIAATCPPGDDASGGGITAAACSEWLHPLSAEATQSAVDCYLPDPGAEGNSCAHNFKLCIQPL